MRTHSGYTVIDPLGDLGGIINALAVEATATVTGFQSLTVSRTEGVGADVVDLLRGGSAVGKAERPPLLGFEDLLDHGLNRPAIRP